MKRQINNLIIILTLIICFSCANDNKIENQKVNLFLNFTSGITLEEYQKIANETPELTVSKEAIADYNYVFYLKSTSLKATIHPSFNSMTKGLEQFFIHGSTMDKSQIKEFKEMFIEKYNTPTITSEETSIKTLEKSSCLNWTENKKGIRLCIDSILNTIPITFKNDSKLKSNNQTFTYYFEIYYIDTELKNSNLNKKTKSVI